MKKVLRAIGFYLFEDYINDTIEFRMRYEHNRWLEDQWRELYKDQARQQMQQQLEFFRKAQMDTINSHPFLLHQEK